MDFLPKLNSRGLSSIILVVILAVIVGIASLYYFYGRSSIAVPTPVTNPKKIGIIQYLPLLDSAVTGFKDGMKELGYIENKDVVYEYDNAGGNPKKVQEIAERYVSQKVDLIYAITSDVASAALKATASSSAEPKIPIVFGPAVEPLKQGIVKSFDSSGNNTTGISDNLVETTAKKLEFLKRINPNAKKIGLFVPKFNIPSAKFLMDELHAQAPNFGMTVVEYPLQSPPGPDSTKELQKVIDGIKPGEIDAIYMTTGPIPNSPDNLKLIIGLQNRLKVPGIFLSLPHAELGGLFVYGEDVYQTGKDAAAFADKILKGTKPADIPISNLSKNVLVVNLKTAKQLGITIPDDILKIATKKIE